MQWFAVRTIYQHSTESDGTGVFEERLVLFRAINTEEAAQKAEMEASAYLKINEGFIRSGEIDVYSLGHNANELDGTEVWSMVNEAKMDLGEFIRQKFRRFEYQTTSSTG